jgi:CMP-N,N'-diacetyllegionaminic acid synthase
MAVLGIIPARGGSKGIPRKNIRLLCGKPLIAYSIEQARNSKGIDYFIVSTDDDEIAEVARSWGAEVLMRPSSLAQDETPTTLVIEDVLARLDLGRKRFDILTLLQPTCPFRSADDIDSSIALLLTGGADAVVGVYRVHKEHPAWMFRIDGGWLQPLDAELSVMSRQELPPVYQRNGVIYTIRRHVFEREHTFWPKRSIPYIMSKERSINIDEPMDWLIAETLMAHE